MEDKIRGLQSLARTAIAERRVRRWVLAMRMDLPDDVPRKIAGYL